MNKLLFITADTKPENESICRQLGRELINRLHIKNPDYKCDELDLYTANIPDMNSLFVTDEVALVTGKRYDSLSPEEKKQVDRIDELCNQFLASDLYVIAAPMWSLSFPSRLKQYIDCIVLGNKFLTFNGNSKPTPLLNDKKRTMIYLQTSGGDYPFWMEHKINYAIDYCHDLFKGLGIKYFDKVLVEGTIQYKENPDKYLNKAYKDIDTIIKKIE